MFEHYLHPIYRSSHLRTTASAFTFHYFRQVLFTLRVSLLVSSLNDAFVDILDDEDSFEFSPKSEFTRPLYVHITLATDTKAAYSCFAYLLQC